MHTSDLQPTAAPRLSQRLWGIDLREGLPRVISADGIEATWGELPRIREFVAREFPRLAEAQPVGGPSPVMQAAKLAYLEEHSDLFELRHNGQTIGVMVGAPLDWSSYYLRTFALSQHYQRAALKRRFVRECLIDPLAAHQVERLIADTSPTNLAASRGLTELHFYATGQELSERWGPMVRYTKFLNPATEAAFQARFAGTAAPAQ